MSLRTISILVFGLSQHSYFLTSCYLNISIVSQVLEVSGNLFLTIVTAFNNNK